MESKIYNSIPSHPKLLPETTFTEFFEFCNFVLAYEDRSDAPIDCDNLPPFFRSNPSPQSVGVVKSRSPESQSMHSEDRETSTDTESETSDHKEHKKQKKQPPKKRQRPSQGSDRNNKRKNNGREKNKKKSADNDDSDNESASSCISSSQNDVELVYPSDDESWNLVTCFCRRPFAGRPMIECSKCLTWIHLSCAKIKKNSVPDVFVCKECKSKAMVRRSRRKR